MSTITTRNFSLLNVSAIDVVASGVTSTVLLPPGAGDDIVLVNNTPTVIFVRTGTSAVTADLLAMPILPGEKGAYSIGRARQSVTHISVITTGVAASLTAVRGVGN